ncbi:MAG: hypothetical protein HQK96_14390 [Nitrospirae bacterium]|nr:hypothetical protein [Nitrospirota bacterium]
MEEGVNDVFEAIYYKTRVFEWGEEIEGGSTTHEQSLFDIYFRGDMVASYKHSVEAEKRMHEYASRPIPPRG